jgi:hypothetical protein
LVRKKNETNIEKSKSDFSPECRTKSDFVTPTKYWPENEQAKHELIKAYKENLQ